MQKKYRKRRINIHILFLRNRGSGGKFEKVKGGGKQMDDPANKGPQLSLGNKYTALQGGTE